MRVPRPPLTRQLKIQEIQLFDGYESNYTSNNIDVFDEKTAQPQGEEHVKFSHYDLAVFYLGVAALAIIVTIIIVYAVNYGSD